jgi:hypothetical protein
VLREVLEQQKEVLEQKVLEQLRRC